MWHIHPAVQLKHALIAVLLGIAVAVGGAFLIVVDTADHQDQAEALDTEAAVDDASGDAAYAAEAEMDAEAAGTDGTPEVGTDASARETAQPRRQLIRTGSVVLEVEDFEATSDEITTLATDNGGFVAESNQDVRTYDNQSVTSGRIVVRVPDDEFRPVYEALQTYGEVEAASTSTEDVTDQLVDIEARLENLRAERNRLRALYDDANETRDVLAVQNELSRVQEEIERLEAQQRALEDRVSMSTIRVDLSEPVPDDDPREEPTDDAWYEIGVLEAMSTSFQGLLTAGRAAVVLGAYATPFLALGLPVIGALYRYR